MTWILKANQVYEFSLTITNCSLKDICKEFSISEAKASEYRRLGEAIQRYPEIATCVSKNTALSFMARKKRDEVLEILSVTRHSEFKYDTVVHDTYHGYMNRKDTRARFDTIITTAYRDTITESMINVSRNPLVSGERLIFIVCRGLSFSDVYILMTNIRAQGYELRPNPLLWISNNKIIGHIVVAGNGTRFNRLNIDDIQYHPASTDNLATPVRMIKVLLKHAVSQYVLDPFCVYGDVLQACAELSIKYVGICHTYETYNHLKEKLG
jgi:hypothetical protein